MRNFPVTVLRVIRLGRGLGLLVLALTTGCGESRRADALKQGEALVAEVAARNRFFRDPAPTPDGKELWFVATAPPEARRLRRLDLTELVESRVLPEVEVGRVYGWSPEGRWLAFTELGARAKRADYRQQVEYPQTERLRFWDGKTGQVLAREAQEEDFIEGDLTWLDGDTALFTRYDLRSGRRVNCWLQVTEGVVRPVAAPPVSLVGMDANRFAYCDGLNVFAVTVDPAGTNRLTHFRRGDFDVPRWLRYRAADGAFLFCARPQESDWRLLFQVTPTERAPRRLSEADTYNGQWLRGLDGFSYVANRSNRFSLVVQTGELGATANLFTRGTIESYSASPFAPLIYAVGATGTEPPALWEYGYVSGRLRKVSGGGGTEAAPRDLPVYPLAIRRPDGTDIPCLEVRPPQGVPERGIIFHLPAPTGQFRPHWEPSSQWLARLGYRFVAINYRGCDGYGRAYASGFDPQHAVADVIAVRNTIVGATGGPPPACYLTTQSGGASVAEAALLHRPEWWRGAVFRQSGMNFSALVNRPGSPRLLVIMGTADRAFEPTRQRAADAAKQGLPVRFVSLEGAGHTLAYQPARFLEQERAILHFLADDW